MQHAVETFRITRYAFPRDRVIGDSQLSYDMNHFGALELIDVQGMVGLGFFFSHIDPLIPESDLTKVFRERHMPAIAGHPPESLLHRVPDPQTARDESLPYSIYQAIDQALWDLAAQRAAMPLYRYLGGDDPRVPVYASGCCFPLTEEQLVEFYTRVKGFGCSAYKVKVGHPDVEWDLRRLSIVRDTVGTDATLMADANEAWRGEEAARRLQTYADNGFELFWIEDPVKRDDIDGMRAVRTAAPDIRLNLGEYLDMSGKRDLIERGVADIVNIHGDISGGLRIGWFAAEHHTPISLGNTPMELGAHIAAALPNAIMTEVSFHNTDDILSEKLTVQDGYITLSDRPGHGLKLSAEARMELRQAESG